MKAVSAATDLVVKEGGVIHEESMWDANEMALDGEPVKSIAKQINDARKGELYRPAGRWSTR